MAAVEGHQSLPPHNSTIRSQSVTINLLTMESGRVERPGSSLAKGDRLRSGPNTPDSASSMERPSSALARGVQITQYKGNKVNPDPVILQDSEVLMEEYLSPRKLRDLTGEENLEDVTFLEMKVDTRDTSLGNFGVHLPNLTQLKLSNSIIETIRDLGTSLNSLRVLWMARCGLEDISGISSMNSLQEVYLAYNEIYDISPFSMLESLKILDLEGNNIEEASQVEYLSLCNSLTNLTLEGNPVCMTPSPDEADPSYNYRQTVKTAVPHLRILDDEQLRDIPSGPQRAPSVFEDDWKLIDELLREGQLGDSEESLESFGRPGSAIRPTTGYRPGSALKQQLGTAVRPMSGMRRPGSGMSRSVDRPGSAGRPGSAARPSTSMRSRNPDAEDLDNEEDASDLTRGGVVCGNPSKALRQRQRSPAVAHETPKLLSKLRHKSEHTYDVQLEDDDKLKYLFSELKNWKQDHQKRRQEIEATKAPQVLKIDHDDAVAVSDSGSEVESEEDDDIQKRIAAIRVSSTSSSASRSPMLAESGRLDESRSPALTPPDARPKAGSSAFRNRKYKARKDDGVIENNVIERRRRLQHDESFEARDEGSSPTQERRELRLTTPDRIKSQSQNMVQSGDRARLREDEDRPNSGPVVTNKAKYRLSPVDKTEPKVIDKSNPVIRASVHSPDKPRLSEGAPRAGTSPSSVTNPAQLSRLRKGALPNVALLPSKNKLSK